MKPLDDELRAVLSSRADSLPLVSDPIVGIERRARRMRRNRVAASIAGTALAVTAIAVAVPALTTSSTESLPQYADPTPTPAPSAEPTPVPASPYALNPANPWPYRGTPISELGQGTIETITREYAGLRGVEESAVTLTPLFGQVYEPSARAEVVFVATVDGDARWGLAMSTESGPEFLGDAPLTDLFGLALPLAGDEVARLLVVAAPGTAVEYAGAGQPPAPMTEIADGVFTGPLLERDQLADRYRVLAPDGTVLRESAAPELPRSPDEFENTGDADPPLEGTPSNVVDWPVRGTADAELYQQALRAFARETGAAPEAVDAKVLYAGNVQDRNIMLLQAWRSGEDARTFGYLEAAGNESTWLGEFTAPGPAVLAFAVPAEAAFLPHDLLVVVPEPAAGQVLYDTDSSGEPEPVADQGTEAAVVIERTADPCCDRVLVLDGNGDFDRPIFRGTVADLLATF